MKPILELKIAAFGGQTIHVDPYKAEFVVRGESTDPYPMSVGDFIDMVGHMTLDLTTTMAGYDSGVIRRDAFLDEMYGIATKMTIALIALGQGKDGATVDGAFKLLGMSMEEAKKAFESDIEKET